MKSIRIFAATAALALCSCTALTTAVTSPAAVSSQTSLDERTLLGAEFSYNAARTLLEAAVDSGVVKPGLARKFYAANGKTNAVLVRARNAYDALNSGSMTAALSEAEPLLAELWKIVGEQEKPDAV